MFARKTFRQRNLCNLKGVFFRGGGAGATMDPEAFLDMANQVLITIIKMFTITIMEININGTIYFYAGP